MAMLELPKKVDAHVKGCLDHMDMVLDGRDSRQAIHDAIQYLTEVNASLSTWCNDIGLCVVDGKLNVVYEG